jgi:hypothetical protein
MHLTDPSGLFLLILLPLIALLHRGRRRATTRRVAGLFLWRDPALRQLQARARSRSNRGLCRDLGAAAILAVLAAGPQIGESPAPGGIAAALGGGMGIALAIATLALLCANWREGAARS